MTNKKLTEKQQSLFYHVNDETTGLPSLVTSCVAICSKVATKDANPFGSSSVRGQLLLTYDSEIGEQVYFMRRNM